MTNCGSSIPPESAACLVLHGYGGTPFEVEALGDALRKNGLHVSTPCLPGHGENDGIFNAFGFPDWLDCAEREYEALQKKYAKVFVIGFSMGGTLALNIAARFPVAGIVTLATPVYAMHLFPWPRAHMSLYLSRAKTLLGNEKKDQTFGETSRDIAPWKGYAGSPNIGQLFSLRRGCAVTRRILSQVHAPLLVMHDVGDRIVPVGNAEEIARRVGSQETILMYTRIQETVTRHHMITTHRETACLVTRKAVAFCDGINRRDSAH